MESVKGMTLIICALKAEAKPFIKAIKKSKTTRNGKLKTYHGTIDNFEVVIACCGVGLETAAASTQTLIDNYEITRIIMSGTAGGIGKKIDIGHTIVSTELLYHDNSNDEVFIADSGLLESFKNAVKKNPPVHKVHFGRISSGGKFITGDTFASIAKKYNPLCVDMETAAVAEVCNKNNIPFIAVRSVTDTREKSGMFTFFRYMSSSAKNSFIVVKKLLSELKETHKGCTPE